MDAVWMAWQITGVRQGRRSRAGLGDGDRTRPNKPGFGPGEAEVTPDDFQTTVPYLHAALFSHKWGINCCLQKNKKGEEEAAFSR